MWMVDQWNRIVHQWNRDGFISGIERGLFISGIGMVSSVE